MDVGCEKGRERAEGGSARAGAPGFGIVSAGFYEVTGN